MLAKSPEDLLKHRQEIQDFCKEHEEKSRPIRLMLRRKLIRAFETLWALDINPDYFPIELVEAALNEDPLYALSFETLKHDGYKIDSFADVLALVLEARLVVLHKDDELLRNAYKIKNNKFKTYIVNGKEYEFIKLIGYEHRAAPDKFHNPNFINLVNKLI